MAFPCRENVCSRSVPFTLSAEMEPFENTKCPDTSSKSYGESSGADTLKLLHRKSASIGIRLNVSCEKFFTSSYVPFPENVPSKCPESPYPSIFCKYATSSMSRFSRPSTENFNLSKSVTERFCNSADEPPERIDVDDEIYSYVLSLLKSLAFNSPLVAMANFVFSNTMLPLVHATLQINEGITFSVIFPFSFPSRNMFACNLYGARLSEMDEGITESTSVTFDSTFTFKSSKYSSLGNKLTVPSERNRPTGVLSCNLFTIYVELSRSKDTSHLKTEFGKYSFFS